MVVAADGELLARAPQFVEHLLTVDLTFDPAAVPERRDGRVGPMTVTRHLLSEEPVAPFEPRPGTVVEPLTDCEEVWRALVLGLRDFIDKNGMPSVVLGLSGGIDSAAGRRPRRRRARRRPGVRRRACRRSGPASTRSPTPRTRAKRLGMHYSVVPIAPMVDAYHGRSS